MIVCLLAFLCRPAAAEVDHILSSDRDNLDWRDAELNTAAAAADSERFSWSLVQNLSLASSRGAKRQTVSRSVTSCDTTRVDKVA